MRFSRFRLPLALAAPLLLAGLAPLFAGSAAAATLPKPNAAYTATRVMNGSGQEMVGKIYHDHGKERWESNAAGMEQVMIRRPDQEKVYMIMPRMNAAMEMPLKDARDLVDADVKGVEAEDLGREEIAGESTTKYRRIEESQGQTFTILTWMTDDGIPLRMQMQGPQGDLSVELRDLQRGAQDPKLFELPEGVEVMPANPELLGLPPATGQQ